MDAIISEISPKSSQVDKKDLDNYSFLLLQNVNRILEIIIRNTLQLNKFSTIDEITENFGMMTIETPSIEEICELLSQSDGILIKYIHKDKVSYRLNNKFYM